MYKLPKEVFDVILRASRDPVSGERVIGYICGKKQEIYEDMEFVLQKFMPGEQGPAAEYWLYRMEEFGVGEVEVEFEPDWAGKSSEDAAPEADEIYTPPEAEDPKKAEEPEQGEDRLETIVISSLSELVAREPGLGKYINIRENLN
ncbi:MAG TPA: hypothetical protein HA362_08030 [Nanoarchaeota archaeon]|nr:hypothetical protein [Nanoarchaeota archaeon]